MQGNEFPPKNRSAIKLQVPEIWITHADGVFKTDPNGCALSAAMALNEISSPASKDFLDFNHINPSPDFPSVFSGKPAFRYQADDIDLSLTKDELIRFLAHNLVPSEYFQLRETYGIFFEIHDDFYSYDSGESLQPM